MILLRAIAAVALRPREAFAALQLADALIESVEDLVELRQRMARRAMDGDLDDSIQLLLRLRRNATARGPAQADPR